MAWYLTDQLKSDYVSKELATLELCSVKSWKTVDEPRTTETGLMTESLNGGGTGITSDEN